jgi:hypothetical protein
MSAGERLMSTSRPLAHMLQRLSPRWMAEALASMRRSHASSSVTQRPCSKVASLRRPRRWKSADREAPFGRSRRVKKTVIRGRVAVSSLCGGPLLVADFDQFEWEIMYPHFVESGLVDAPNRMDN